MYRWWSKAVSLGSQSWTSVPFPLWERCGWQLYSGAEMVLRHFPCAGQKLPYQSSDFQGLWISEMRKKDISLSYLHENKITEGALGEVFTEAELKQRLWQMMALPYLNITFSIIYTLFTPASNSHFRVNKEWINYATVRFSEMVPDVI